MLLRKRIITVVTAVALMVAVGASSVVADALGLSVTPQAYACETGGSSGGNC